MRLLLLLIVLVGLGVIFWGGDVEGEISAETDKWAAIRANDIAHLPAGWSTPIRIHASDDNWEDSLFVMPDGQTIYFMYYPAPDLWSDIKNGTYADDIDIYRSDAPFTTKQRDNRYYFSEELYSAAGQMIATTGDAYYHSNRFGDPANDDLYRNTERLPFNTTTLSERNPHYCPAKDELWFDDNDNDMYILRNAAADNFTGTPQLAPAPINAASDDTQDLQAWLNADCDILYFTSSRDRDGLAIFKSQRLVGGNWSEPELIIHSRYAVGEPSFSNDGNRLFFIQLFSDGEGNFRTDMFYTQRIQAYLPLMAAGR